MSEGGQACWMRGFVPMATQQHTKEALQMGSFVCISLQLKQDFANHVHTLYTTLHNLHILHYTVCN